MSENTKIQWCDHTFNPWIGCTKVAAGCTNCYAEADMDKRRGRVNWGPNGTRSKTSESYWKKPLKWNREAEESGVRTRVFCASICDVFEDWQGPIYNHRNGLLMRSTDGYVVGGETDDPRKRVTMNDLRHDLFRLIDNTPNLDWLLLTKRPENIRQLWPNAHSPTVGLEKNVDPYIYRPNIWIGSSVAEQKDADQNIPELLKCRDMAPVLFVSYEPAIGPVDFTYPPSLFPDGPRYCCGGFECGCRGMPVDPPPWLYDGIDWVIVGGESGPNARPFNVDWARQTVQQCHDAGVACFVKQMGSNAVDWNPETELTQQVPFSDRKGGDPSEWPANLRVRELPQESIE